MTTDRIVLAPSAGLEPLDESLAGTLVELWGMPSGIAPRRDRAVRGLAAR